MRQIRELNQATVFRGLCVFAGSLAMLAIASCSDSDSPTAPAGPSTTPVIYGGYFVGNIMDADTRRVCIDHARAEIIAGTGSGTVYPQNRDSCEDPGSGFVINGLRIGEVLRLRASAPGYTSVERDFDIEGGGSSVDINLKRAE